MEADAAVVDVYHLSADMPDAERYGLQMQLRRAAVSVATNIVEGSARWTSSEYQRFLSIAHASARESEYLIGLAARLRMMDERRSQALAERYGGIAGALYKLIQAIAAAERAGKDEFSG